MRPATIAVLTLALIHGSAFAQSEERSPEIGPPIPQAITPKPSAAPVAAPGGDWRASKLIGASVRNIQDQSLGEIEDVILDSEGKVVSVIISVGGFLGLGEKNVAVAYRDLMIGKSDDGDPVVQISLSKQALETAPASPSD